MSTKQPSAEAVLAELGRRERERPYEFWRFKATPKQLAVHQDQHKRRVVLGGNRSGKSVVGAVDVGWTALGVHPFRQCRLPARIWAVAVDFPTLRDGTKAEYFDKLFMPSGLLKYYAGDMVYEVVKGPGRGSVIGLKSCDSGREKFQSVTRDVVWFDEEPKEEIYNECLARTLDCDGSIILTFTPLEGFSWSYKRLYLNDARDPEVAVHHLPTVENPIFGSPEEAVKRISATYKGVSEGEMKARLYGEYIPLAGACVFDPLRLVELRGKCVTPRLGELVNEGSIDDPAFKFVEQRLDPKANNHMALWAEPVKGHEYVVSGDPAEGLAHGDYSSAYVFDRHTNLFVAEWHGHIDPDLFARQVLAPVGQWYNDAAIIPEDNNHGMAVLAILRLVYANLFVRRTVDTARGIVPAFGFRTTARSKAVLIDALLEWVRTAAHVPEALLDEMATFIRDERGRMNAQEGAYDDRVIAAALCLHAHLVLPPVDPLPPEPDKENHNQWVWDQKHKQDEETKLEREAREGELHDFSDSDMVRDDEFPIEWG